MLSVLGLSHQTMYDKHLIHIRGSFGKPACPLGLLGLRIQCSAHPKALDLVSMVLASTIAYNFTGITATVMPCSFLHLQCPQLSRWGE